MFHPKLSEFQAANYRHLVTDEIVVFPVQRSSRQYGRYVVEVPYRLRIWRVKDRSSVVLVSQADPSWKPSQLNWKLVNLVYSQYLGFQPEGFTWFEQEWHGDSGGIDLVYHVRYTGEGHRHRLLFGYPVRELVEPQDVELAVGQPVDWTVTF